MNNYDLKQEIKKLGMTQKAFAEYIGVAEVTVGTWARGETKTPEWVKLIIDLTHKANKYEQAKRLFNDMAE